MIQRTIVNHDGAYQRISKIAPEDIPKLFKRRPSRTNQGSPKRDISESAKAAAVLMMSPQPKLGSGALQPDDYFKKAVKPRVSTVVMEENEVN